MKYNVMNIVFAKSREAEVLNLANKFAKRRK